MALKTYLTSTEIQRMIDAAPCLRDKVIIMFLADCGCRVTELISVKVSDIDFEKEVVLIPHLKVGIRKRCPGCGRTAGSRQRFCSRCGIDISAVMVEGTEERKRIISIGTETLKVCQEYIARRKNKTERLIPITRQAVGYRIRELAERAGLGGEIMINPETGKKHYVHSHSFRDALCVDWLSTPPEGYTEDESRKALQRHLGHKRFETTARYQKITVDKVQKISNVIRSKRFKKKEVPKPLLSPTTGLP